MFVLVEKKQGAHTHVATRDQRRHIAKTDLQKELKHGVNGTTEARRELGRCTEPLTFRSPVCPSAGSGADAS